MDFKMICQAWDLNGDYEIKEINQGFMNQTYAIDLEDSSFILRIYESDNDIAKVRREFKILEYLNSCKLSFEVPVFLINKFGDYLYQVSETGVLAVVMPLLKGGSPDLGNPVQAYEAGRALGELNIALSRLDEGFFKKLGQNPSYNQFHIFHPAVKNIDEVIDELPTSLSKKQDLHRIFQRLDKELVHVYPSLQKQYIHGDYTPGNVLICDGRINGIIDFEFSCYDVRVMDLAIALGGGPAALWELDQTLANITMFTKGYVTNVPLSEKELLSIPFLIRLRRAAMFVYFTARYLNGLDSEGWMRGIVDWVIDCENWLFKNRECFLRKIKEGFN